MSDKKEDIATVVMDTQERRRFKNTLEKIMKLPVKVTPLRAGDFLMSGEKGTVLIERKSMNDFAGSVSSNQLIKELQQMHEETKGIENIKKFVLIEGSLIDLIKRGSRWIASPLLKAIAMIPISWNINIVWMENKDLTEAFIYSLAEYLGAPRNPPQIYGSRPKRKLSSMDEQQRFFLEGIAGVGGKKADQWLRASGTVWNFLENCVMGREKAPGMGPGTKKAICDLLNHRYGEKRTLKEGLN